MLTQAIFLPCQKAAISPSPLPPIFASDLSAFKLNLDLYVIWRKKIVTKSAMHFQNAPISRVFFLVLGSDFELMLHVQRWVSSWKSPLGGYSVQTKSKAIHCYFTKNRACRHKLCHKFSKCRDFTSFFVCLLISGSDLALMYLQWRVSPRKSPPVISRIKSFVVMKYSANLQNGANFQNASMISQFFF